MVGFDAAAVRLQYGERATCLLNPFFEHAGILSSVWLARRFLDGQPFVFTTGDHYFAHLGSNFLADQPQQESPPSMSRSRPATTRT